LLERARRHDLRPRHTRRAADHRERALRLLLHRGILERRLHRLGLALRDASEVDRTLRARGITTEDDRAVALGLAVDAHPRDRVRREAIALVVEMVAELLEVAVAAATVLLATVEVLA